MVDLLRCVPPLPQTERGHVCIVGADKNGERLLYCNGNNILWRSLTPLVEGMGAETPEDIFCYSEHSKKATCVSMSSNNEWVCSGDVSGSLRVWGAKGDHVLKGEYKLWDGVIKDCSWSGDNTRIVAAGDGKETRAAALIWDTGSKTGNIGGHAKMINSISFRSQRPFRCITGGEDMSVGFHEGPPFKLTKSHSVHTNFVNCVRFSPDGEWAVSAGSDSKLCLYEGKSGEFEKEFEKPKGIAGSLWQCAWSPDSSRVATAGGDKVLRIWDRATATQVFEAKVGEATLDDMQVGLSWVSAERVVTVCLDGRLLCWDVAADGSLKLAAAIEGTQGALSSLAYDAKCAVLLQAGADGVVARTPAEGTVSMTKIGKGVVHLVAHSASFAGPAEAWVVSLDDCVRRISLETGAVAGPPVEVKEFAKGAAWLDKEETKLLIVSSKQSLICVSSTGVEWAKPYVFERTPTAMAVAPELGLVAVAVDKPDVVSAVVSQQYDICIFGLGDPTSPECLVPRCVLEGHRGEVTAMAFSQEHGLLVSGDASNRITVWDVKADPPVKVGSDYQKHTARVTSLAWLPGTRRFVSGSLDQKVFLWEEGKSSPEEATGHRGGVSAIVATGGGAFATVGQDGFLRVQKPK